jgi:integrase
MRSIQKASLTASIDRYIAYKRSLGKELTKPSGMLRLLNGHLAAQGVVEPSHITPTQVDTFVASRRRRSARSYNVLLSALRGLFDWMVAQGLITVSPLLCKARRLPMPQRPFLFNKVQVRCLLAAAAELPSTPRALDRGEIYKNIFGLLYGLGLRVGEVARLCRKDVDLEAQLLIIRKAKFGKDRFVPFGPCMGRAIAGFIEREESSYGPIPSEAPMFSFTKEIRRPVGKGTISWTFHKLLPALNLTIPSGTAAPHLHCLRHSFAVGTLLRWYREGVDPMSRLFDLSTFLGHVSPSSTAYYLTITDDLLEQAGDRFGQFAINTRKESIR